MARIVVALGGNALENNGEASAESQQKVASTTARELAKLVRAGHEVIIGHGNGPQVGNIMLHEELAATDKAPAMPLNTAVAMSQGQIGYWLQQALANELRAVNVKKSVVTIITQVVVDVNDPEFWDPSKPIGQFYDKITAKKIASERGWTVKEDAGRGWRRVVPSPRPVRIVELPAIASLSNGGAVVIAAGGGGIPVVSGRTTSKLINDVKNTPSNSDNTATVSIKDVRGVDAVIDKDFAASLLARDIGANVLLILTTVPNVTINYKKPNEKPIGKTTVRQMQAYANAGQFAPGSMLPKVRAAAEFVQHQTDNVAIITTPDRCAEAMTGKIGTIIRA